MPQSSTPRASTVVKTAALLMAVPALLTPMKVAAQQMATNTLNFSRCDQMSATNPKGAIACRVEVLNASAAAARKEGAAADARGAAADVRAACANEIGDLRRNSVFGDKATEIAREIVKASGRPAIENDACALRDGIRAGLTRLKLLPARVSLN